MNQKNNKIKSKIGYDGVYANLSDKKEKKIKVGSGLVIKITPLKIVSKQTHDKNKD